MYVYDSREPAVTLGLAFVGGIVATTLLTATGGTHHVNADLPFYVALAALVALTARWWAMGAGAVVLWLFYDGFLVGRHAVIVWHGGPDAWRLALILAGGIAGLTVGRTARFATGMAS